MDIKKLMYFKVVCEHMNMTRAAEELHVAQPSVSNSIRQLETELDMALFDRRKRQLKLTDKGMIFLEKARAVLDLVEDVEREMLDLGRADVGQIKLGVPPMIGTLIFPRILTGFKASQPFVRLMLTEDGSLETRRKILEGEVDMGIIILTETDEALEAIEILSTEIVVCMPPGHRLGSHSSISIRDMAEERLIMLKEGFYHREVLLNQFETHGIAPEIIVSTNQLKTLESLVIQGVGLSFLFREIAEENREMIFRPLENTLSVQIGLAWRKDRYLSKASRTLIDFFTSDSQARQ